MVIINSGIIHHLIHLQKIRRISNSRIQSRSVSKTLVITTFLFVIMTVPATVSYAFFSGIASTTVLHMMDGISYSYHVTSFLLYFITFTEFRKVFIAMIKCSKIDRTIGPQLTI
jgi:hypothetical protein